MSKRKRVNKNCKNRVNRSKRHIDAENDDNLELPPHVSNFTILLIFILCYIIQNLNIFTGYNNEKHRKRRSRQRGGLEMLVRDTFKSEFLPVHKLLQKMLIKDPERRCSIDDILKDECLTEFNRKACLIQMSLSLESVHQKM